MRRTTRTNNRNASTVASGAPSTRNNNQVYNAITSMNNQSNNSKQRPLDTLFILLKHRRLHFDQFHTNSNIQYQLLKWLSEVSTSDMKLNSSNEAYLAYIYEICKRDLNQIKISLPTTSSNRLRMSDDHWVELSKLFTVRWIPLSFSSKAAGGVSLLVLLLLCSFAYYSGLMYWRRKWRQKSQQLRWVNNVATGSVIQDMYQHYPAPRTSIPVPLFRR